MTMHFSIPLPAAVAVLSFLPASLATPVPFRWALGPKLSPRDGTDYSITGLSITIADGGNQGMLESYSITMDGQTCVLTNVRERDQIDKQQIAFDCGQNPDIHLFMMLPQMLRAEADGRQPEGTNRNINLLYLGGDGQAIGVVIHNLFDDDNVDCSSGTAPLTCNLKSGKTIGSKTLSLD